jgi:hypothetical protein
MARSLSLVSKAFYDISRSLRLQSVRCDGLDKIIGFASVLDRTPPSLRVVRHLFITSYNYRKGPVSKASLFQSVTAMLSPRRRKADRENEAHASSLRAHASLLHILTIIAPTLRTLALRIQFSWAQLPFPPSLPALAELSIQHPFADGYLDGEAFDCIHSAPSLRRLVLTGFRLVPHKTEVVASINRFAPSLTHLGVPGEFSCMSLLVCLMAAAADRQLRTSGVVFTPTREDLVIEDALMGHPGNSQIILARRSGSQDEWQAWIGGPLMRT